MWLHNHSTGNRLVQNTVYYIFTVTLSVLVVPLDTQLMHVSITGGTEGPHLHIYMTYYNHISLLLSTDLIENINVLRRCQL